MAPLIESAFDFDFNVLSFIYSENSMLIEHIGRKWRYVVSIFRNVIVGNRGISQLVPGLMLSALSIFATLIPSDWWNWYIRSAFTIVIIVLVVFQFVVYTTIRKYGNFGRIFSMMHWDVIFITSHALASEENMRMTPPFEAWGVDTLDSYLKYWGRRSKKYFHSDDQCPNDWDRDLIVVGGPYRNDKARLLNEVLLKQVPGAFCFIEPDQGKAPFIGQFVLSDVIVPYAGLAQEGATHDHGLIYIGPNTNGPHS